MEKILNKMYLLFFFFLYSIAKIDANEVLGCGGFVHSGVDINYSSIKIYLLSEHGTKKYETECAPTNGYYFIPVYDKGTYTLKVEHPQGWKFSPEEVPITIDGETDLCSQGKDINFSFQGFAVVGRVVSFGSQTGPEGIPVAIHKDGKEILKAVTHKDGNYIFSPLGAGDYNVVASHEKWKFNSNQVSVSVKDSNGNAGDGIVVQGYNINGKMAVSSSMHKSVILALAGSSNVPYNLGCKKEIPKECIIKSDWPVLCYVQPSEKGKYSFMNIPTGSYTIYPVLCSSVEFSILPNSVKAQVEHGDLAVTEDFIITGGKLLGKVESSERKGLTGVKIVLDDDKHTVSNNAGEFSFPSVNFGSHVIAAVHDDMEFDDLNVDFSMKENDIPTLVPSRYKACFLVNVDQNMKQDKPWTVRISGKNMFIMNVEVEKEKCIYLLPGSYSASINLDEAPHSGIRFNPQEHKFDISSSSVEKISFSQFLGEINGDIKCIEKCPDITVKLKSSNPHVDDAISTVSKNGKFNFKEVIPGSYQLSVDKSDWCWEKDVVNVSIHKEIENVLFKQSGYKLVVSSSEELSLQYVRTSEESGEFSVNKGITNICLPFSGLYSFNTVGCHRVKGSPIKWDTHSGLPIYLETSHHKMSGAIKSNEASVYSVTVTSGSSESKVINVTASSSDNTLYPFEYWAAENDRVSIVPSSSLNLFKFSPATYNFTMGSKCLLNVVIFYAERSLFLQGKIKPAVNDVSVLIDDETSANEVIYADGSFSVGPMDRTKNYKIKPEKIGYVFVPSEYTHDASKNQDVNVIEVVFEAKKLAEINVQVLTEEGEPLEGVLVSTSSGRDYRQNVLTDTEGSIRFHSLMPNDYFLRPMMKEYEFQPSSKEVKVEGGKTHELIIRGKRIAYSIYGNTMSINGEPENDVVVEAISVGTKCESIQEDAVSDHSGKFRIRGLKPQCEYSIKLKEGGNYWAIQESVPVFMKNEDMREVNIVMIRPFNHMDVALTVNTQPHLLPLLTAEMYRGNEDNPLYKVKVNNHRFVMFPPMSMDNKEYYVQVTFTQPQHKYKYVVPQTSFKANSSFKNLNLSLSVNLKSVEAEISKSTIAGFVFFVFAIACALNYEYILSFDYSKLNRSFGKSSQDSSSRDDNSYAESANIRRRIKPKKI